MVMVCSNHHFFAVFTKMSDIAQQILEAPQEILEAPQEILEAL